MHTKAHTRASPLEVGLDIINPVTILVCPNTKTSIRQSDTSKKNIQSLSINYQQTQTLLEILTRENTNIAT